MAIDNILILSTETTLTPTITAGQMLASVLINFCNFSELTDEEITIYVKKSGNSAGDLTTNFKKLMIEKTDSALFNAEKYLLTEGDSISAIGENGSIVSATISYIIQ